MRNNLSLIAIAAVVFTALACGGSASPPPAAYVGSWISTDGTYIAIRDDGSADYNAGSSKITGGSAVIDERAKSLKISFASFGPTFTIDKAPTASEMTLSGVVYRRVAMRVPDSDDSGNSKKSSN